MAGPVIMLCGNGGTAAFAGGAQLESLQKPWLLVFAEYLESLGVDPLQFTFEMPNGQRCKLFRAKNGDLNWEFGGE